MHGSQALMVNNHPPSRGGPRTRVVVVKHINSVAACYNHQTDWS